MKAKAAPITVEQYKAFEGCPGLKDELINGEIVLSPQPKPFGPQFSMPAPLSGKIALGDIFKKV